MMAQAKRPPDLESTIKLRAFIDAEKAKSKERGSVPPSPLVELTEQEAIEIAAAVMRKAGLFCAFSGVTPEKLHAFTRMAIKGARK
jgi:hypothetical protein